MREDQLHKRYALALHLIPDPDVAGDLFMDARDEADLVRRAQGWRTRQGLPGAAPGPAPDLTPDQRVHALHLARRGARRRRIRLGLALGAAGALVAAAALWLAPPRSSLASGAAASEPPRDPMFQKEPLASFKLDRAEVAIYEAIATPGSVTLHWRVTGPRAEQAARKMQLEYYAVNAGQVPWILPVEHEPFFERRGDSRGTSVYRLATVDARTANLRIHPGGQEIRFPVRRSTNDPWAQTYPVNREFMAPGGYAPSTVDAVIVGDEYLAVTLSGDKPSADWVKLETDAEPLFARGLWNDGGSPWGHTLLFRPPILPAKELRLSVGQKASHNQPNQKLEPILVTIPLQSSAQ